MTVISVREGETTWLDSLSPKDLPHPLPSGVRVLVQGDRLGLEIQGLVGALPLANGDTLRITPKIGSVNFLRLLFKSDGEIPDLHTEFDRFVEYATVDEANIDSVVARNFFISVAEVLRRSPKFDRLPNLRKSKYVMGQVDTLGTALNVAQRKEDPIVAIVKERSIDIPENRILTEAAQRAFQILGAQERELYGEVYNRWISKFPSSRNIFDDIESVERNFAKNNYGGSRGYYQRALMLAQVILGSYGLGLEGENLVVGDAILINTADVFERYLRNVVRASYSDDGYIVTKGGVGLLSLYTDGSYELEPDIVVYRDGKPKIICDAKYKTPTGPDHYQMHAYLRRYGISSGILLAPGFSEGELTIREYMSTDKIVVREVFLPMESLDATEEFLGTVVQQYASH